VSQCIAAPSGGGALDDVVFALAGGGRRGSIPATREAKERGRAVSEKAAVKQGLGLSLVQGVVPPAAVHGLARRLSQLIDEGLDAPLCASRVLLGDDGRVTLKGGRVSRRWRAPELRFDDDDGMARTAAGDRWALGRMLLELSLGTVVADAVADDASFERLAGLRDLEKRSLPSSLVTVLSALMARKPEDRRFVADASDNTRDVEDRALRRFVAAAKGGTSKTLALESSGIVDVNKLQRLAREISGKMALQSLEHERTGDLPAGAILGREDLARLGTPLVALPTQMLSLPRTPPALVKSQDTVVCGRRPWDDDPRYDDVETTVPIEVEALRQEPPSPTWVATVSIEPPRATAKAKTTKTQAKTEASAPSSPPSSSAAKPKPKTQERPAAPLHEARPAPAATAPPYAPACPSP
jgi:hypothetical protein